MYWGICFNNDEGPKDDVNVRVGKKGMKTFCATKSLFEPIIDDKISVMRASELFHFILKVSYISVKVGFIT